ncbi:MAG: hypothetical protein DMG22_04375 [Acidobacteria bacterium]|nr:MAG: hypothetical protein DMG22_04375 [Acidobacteriota bacterium]
MTHDDVLLAFVILAGFAFAAQALAIWRASSAIQEIRKEVRQVRDDLRQRIETRLQIIRIDQLLTSLVDKVETTTDRVQQTVLIPVQEVSALVKALKVGFGFLFARRRSPSGSETTQDEQLFI